ncbi:MAG: hypothetical protein E2P02_08350 [Acidobacteria bacterium]|nr:MAG: hypothetical protein E2P02_08350 [Acidobacteriota bacterium]
MGRDNINPALVLKEGKPFMAFGTPGGDTQPRPEIPATSRHGQLA